MTTGKIIGRIALGALVLSAIPYKFKKDEKTGAAEVRSLLWGWKKTPRGEGEKARYLFAMPASGLDNTGNGDPRADQRSAEHERNA